MQFKSYKVNPKHRTSSPSENASIWTVNEWIELQLFANARCKNWASIGKDILWAACNGDSGLSKIGRDLSYDLYIAKFRCDHNKEWHGYPVHPRDDDIPPEAVLESWRKEDILDKTEKRRIQTGKFQK
jgi:hypothetical protein